MQSQSLNIHIAEPSTAKLTSMHFYAWKKGLKTGMYYLRTRPKADAIQFTVDQTQLAQSKKTGTASTANSTPSSTKVGMTSTSSMDSLKAMEAIKPTFCSRDSSDDGVCESCSA